MAKEPLSPVLPDDGEKPVREKLQKTSIDAQATEEGINADEPIEDTENTEEDAALKADETMEDANGRLADPSKVAGLRRKRSAEELEEGEDGDPDTSNNGKHVRKKTSADAVADTDAAFKTDATTAQPADTTVEDEENSEEDISEEMRSDVLEAGSQAMEDAPEDDGSSDEDADVESGSVTPERQNKTMDDIAEETLSSPKNKRNRAQFLDDDADAEDSSEKQAAATEKEDTTKTSGAEERSTKRQRSNSPPSKATNIKELPPISSTLSEAKPKSPTLLQTSSSAFAASGFGALASASTSGFGALGKASEGQSPFASAAATSPTKPPSIFASAPSDETKKPASTSTFGSALGAASPFGAVNATNASLGFSSLGGASTFGGSGFGALSGGSKLTSFAGGSGPVITGLSTKPAKPFGVAEDDEEENEEDDDEEEAGEIRSPLSEEDKKDPRFHEQEGKNGTDPLLNSTDVYAVSTGEEGEDTVFSARAKLFAFTSEEENAKKDWHERGGGILKVNVSTVGESTKARLLMRADGSHRVVLNSPIHKDLKFGNVDGEKPTGMTNLFLGTLPGQSQLVSMQLRVSDPYHENYLSYPGGPLR
jgi:Ran-binding protein 3